MLNETPPVGGVTLRSDPDTLINQRQAAHLLGVSPAFLSRLSPDALTFYRIGIKRMYKVAALNEYLDRVVNLPKPTPSA